MRAALLVVLSVALASPAPAGAAEPAPVTLVACAPGYPGTGAEAQPHMDAFAAALAGAAGWPRAALAAVYEETEQGGLARLGRPDAAVALVPLPFLVEHGAALKLAPQLQVEQKGSGLAEVWTLVVRKGAAASPAALDGFTISSIAGYAPRFVRGVVRDLPAGARIVASGQVLSALRKAAAGEKVAVLLDGPQSAALAGLPFAGELAVVARSEPLPSAFVCTVGGRLPPARWKALRRGLEALDRAPGGAAALEGIRMVRFVPTGPAALAQVRHLEGAAR